MHIHAAQPLFAWGELEDYPTLATIRNLLDAVPNQRLLDGLNAPCGAAAVGVTTAAGRLMNAALARREKG